MDRATLIWVSTNATKPPSLVVLVYHVLSSHQAAVRAAKVIRIQWLDRSLTYA